MKYVSLHHHSTFSYMDGFGTPEQHVLRAAELGMEAQAFTEHGNVSSFVQAEKAGVEAGIKIIFGLEAYCAPEDMRETKNRRKWHLTLLAMNQTGYQNLMRIVSLSWADGFYQWPTVSGKMLAKYSEGIICLSGCADSHLSCTLLGGKGRETGDEREALAVMRSYKRIFGDRYYVEVQQFPELARTSQLNPWFEKAARKLGIPLVATADCHYPNPKDNKMQAILHTAGRGLGNVDTAESQWEYDILLTHPTTDRGIYDRLRGTGLSARAAQEAIANTAVISGRCNVELPKVDMLRFPLPREFKSAEELTWQWLREGWKYRWSRNANLRANPKLYKDRIMYEMGPIVEKDYLDYFLMLSEGVRWCKDASIPYEIRPLGPIAVGPARGSAAASLVCYFLRITEVDPVPFPQMLFERFIDVTRTDLPDVDLDFDDERRSELTQHYMDLYGADRVAAIGSFTKYRGKNSLDDVARSFNIPSWEVQGIKDLMIERSGADSRLDSSLEDTIEMFPDAKKIFEKNPNLKYALRLEGNYKGMGQHAAGLAISNEPLSDSLAIYTRTTGTGKKKRTRQVISADKKDAEYMGILKADFLGLTTMNMVARACKSIGMDLEELYSIALDDPKVIEAFHRGDLVGIFQFGGGSTKIVNNDVKPDNFLELCDINALSRPGPFRSGSTNNYIMIKHGKRKKESIHPILDRITADTKGQIIYQEQILTIIREIGGLPWTHIQEIRKIISLKKGEGAFNERYQDFIDGAARLHSIPQRVADDIWKHLVTAGQYAFNIAHCVSYSMLAYWQMWLKVYHPAAFYAACLIKFKKHEYVLLRDAIKNGHKIFPPDLERSGITWSNDEDGIRAGFTQIPGVGEVVAEKIIEWREQNGAFDRWSDLEVISGVGPKTVDRIQAFAEAPDPFGLTRIDDVLSRVRKAIINGELVYRGMEGRYLPIPTPTYKGADIPSDRDNLHLVYMGIPVKRNPQDIIEDERARSGNTLEEVIARTKDPHLDKKMSVECLDDSDALIYVRFGRYVYPKFAEALWDMNLNHDVLIIKGVKKGGSGTNIHVNAAWCIDPDDLIDIEEEDEDPDE